MCGALAWGCTQPPGKPATKPVVPVESKGGPESPDKSGQPSTRARLYVTGPFSQGLAAVETAEGWGYIAKGGTTVITPRYHAAGDFAGSLAPARTSYAIQRKGEGTYGYIDTRGRWVVPPVFDAVSPPIPPPESPLATDTAAPRTATFRDSQYTVDDAGVLRLAGKRVTPDDVAAGAFIKETASDKLLTRMGAHRGLGRLATARAMAALGQVPARRGWQETTATAQGLEEARPGAGVEYLVGFMKDKNGKVRQHALHALLVLGRDPHCARELATRMKLVPEDYRNLLDLRISCPNPDEKLSSADKALRSRLHERSPAVTFPNVPLVLVVEDCPFLYVDVVSRLRFATGWV